MVFAATADAPPRGATFLFRLLASDVLQTEWRQLLVSGMTLLVPVHSSGTFSWCQSLHLMGVDAFAGVHRCRPSEIK